MSSLLAALARALARRPAGALVLAGALWAVAGWSASRLGVDPGNEALFLRGDPARAADALLEEHFSPGALLVLALEGPVLTEAGLERLDDLTLAAADVEGVTQVVSLTNARNIYLGPVDVYAWAPYEWLLDGSSLAACELTIDLCG